MLRAGRIAHMAEGMGTGISKVMGKQQRARRGVEAKTGHTFRLGRRWCGCLMEVEA